MSRLLISTLTSLFLCKVPSPSAEDAKQAPFEIPPNGKPEMLVGGLAFEAPSALAFDSRNRPYMFHTREAESFGTFLTLRNGKWARLSYLEALREAFPYLRLPTKRFLHALGSITIDDSDGLYAVIRIQKDETTQGYVLLYSPDLGESFQVYDLPGEKAFLEIDVGHNWISSPPAVGLLTFRKEHPARWTSYHDLAVLLPVKEGERLILGEPIHISSGCFGVANHSGGYSFAVTSVEKVHLTFAEVSEEPEGGNPTFVATIDRRERRLLAKEYLVTAPPKTPDVHSTPVIALDADRHLHVVAGAHGQEFFYLRSLQPDDISAGWTKPIAMGEKQTYATLICDRENLLHSVYRVHPRLLYQQKSAGADAWSEPVELVRAPEGHKGYSIFYHRLFIDREGALYLSFTFFEFDSAEEGRYPRALAISEDSGRSWSLATTESFARRARPDREKPE